MLVMPCHTYSRIFPQSFCCIGKHQHPIQHLIQQPHECSLLACEAYCSPKTPVIGKGLLVAFPFGAGTTSTYQNMQQFRSQIKLSPLFPFVLPEVIVLLFLWFFYRRLNIPPSESSIITSMSNDSTNSITVTHHTLLQSPVSQHGRTPLSSHSPHIYLAAHPVKSTITMSTSNVRITYSP